MHGQRDGPDMMRTSNGLDLHQSYRGAALTIPRLPLPSMAFLTNPTRQPKGIFMLRIETGVRWALGETGELRAMLSQPT